MSPPAFKPALRAGPVGRLFFWLNRPQPAPVEA